MMKCNIEYVGKARNGKMQYWCTTHKTPASNSDGNKLESCLCPNKEKYENSFNIEKSSIKGLEIVFENILENQIPTVYINQEVFNGILKYKDCVMSYKDLGGILLSKLNSIDLEVVKCSHCNHMHSDNGKFAYTLHRTHLCLYCGHLFRVKERNIGSELATILPIPEIKLNHKKLLVASKCRIQYDLLKGILLINNQNVDKLIISEKEVRVSKFLNTLLENEY